MIAARMWILNGWGHSMCFAGMRDGTCMNNCRAEGSHNGPHTEEDIALACTFIRENPNLFPPRADQAGGAAGGAGN